MGVAACLIGGSTLHSWAGIPAHRTPRGDKWAMHPSPAMAERRKDNILDKSMLTVDEMSLLTTEVLARLSQVLGVVKMNEFAIDSTIPFGNMSVLLTGDFHQFPPVAQLRKALFINNPASVVTQIGQHLFEQFQTVVLLEQQMRIKDKTWHDVLCRARYGECSITDLNVIRELVLTSPSCDVPNFTTPPWNDAVLVTPRNSVRMDWNKAAIRKHCKQSGEVLYVSPAEDCVAQHPVSIPHRLLIQCLSEEQTGRLSNEVELVIGMKVMITENIAPSANIANGSRGTITSILLDEREPVLTFSETEGVHFTRLIYPPAFIVIRLDFTELVQLLNLQKMEIPLSPISRSFRIGSRPSTMVNRRQLAITPAYAFTDFKAQGQTIEKLIVDIGKTVHFSLTPFNAYVALSRSSGREDIRLLRDFEDHLFTHVPSEDLKVEDERLRELANETKKKYYAGKYGAPHVAKDRS